MVVECPSWEVVSWGARFSSDGASNNVEEYRGMIDGLKDVKGRRKSLYDLIVVVGDSKLIIDQMKGICKVGDKLVKFHEEALNLVEETKVIFRWIPREINEAADLMTHVARDNKALANPCNVKRPLEWRAVLKPLLENFISFIEITGKDQHEWNALNEAWDLARDNARKKFHRAFNLMKGDRGYYSTHLCTWISDQVVEASETSWHTGEEVNDRWKQLTVLGHSRVTAESVVDMELIANETTLKLNRFGWKLPKLMRSIRQENIQFPNPHLRPDLYLDKLAGYPEVMEIVKIARKGVVVKMKDGFQATRPWDPNFVREKQAVQLVIEEFRKLFNAGRGVLLNAEKVGDEIKSIVVSSVGAVPKGNKPMSEALRVIGGLSTPKGNSINECTDTVIPDAKFGKIQEIADRILKLKWENPEGTEIMALNADIDSAFYQIPVAAESTGLFALVIPGTDIMWIPYALTFGWTGSPGFFAVFVKGVRWYQQNGGSYVEYVWMNFHCFIWVDDIIIIEPNVEDRLLKAEQRLREGVDLVFGEVGWKHEKFQTWNTKWDSLGLSWNTKSCTVEMPLGKLSRAAEILEEIVDMVRIPLKAVQSILGKLRYLSSCVPVAKAFVQRLQTMVNDGVRENEDWISDFGSAKQDVHFWIEHLKKVDFSSWPLEAFGTTGTAAAVWTCGVLGNKPMISWNGKDGAIIFKEDTGLSLAAYLWLILRATEKWMSELEELHIRVPIVMLLVPSVTWAEAVNKGNATKLGAQEALRALASFQMRRRMWFRATSWGNWGNTVPHGWLRSIKKEQKNANVFQIGLLSRNWMNFQVCYLCKQCAIVQDKLIGVDGAHGSNVQWQPINQYGYTKNLKTNRRWQSFDTSPFSSSIKEIHGQQLRDIFRRCDGCTELISTWNWSRNTPCLPWWEMAVSDGAPNRARGNR